jgi:hypothetical protein
MEPRFVEGDDYKRQLCPIRRVIVMQSLSFMIDYRVEDRRVHWFPYSLDQILKKTLGERRQDHFRRAPIWITKKKTEKNRKKQKEKSVSFRFTEN